MKYRHDEKPKCITLNNLAIFINQKVIRIKQTNGKENQLSTTKLKVFDVIKIPSEIKNIKGTY